MKKYTNGLISALIDEHIHSERDRKVMKLRFIDGYKINRIAETEEIDLSERQVSNIIKKYLNELAEYL